jgi:hypothetical protein
MIERAEPLGVVQVQALCQMARVIIDDERSEAVVILEGWDDTPWDSGDLCFIVSRQVDPDLHRRLRAERTRDDALEDFFDRLFRLALVN